VTRVLRPIKARKVELESANSLGKILPDKRAVTHQREQDYSRSSIRARKHLPNIIMFTPSLMRRWQM
jgi:hypothetical protein